MIKAGYYLLFNDECATCQYIKTVFNLLKFPSLIIKAQETYVEKPDLQVKAIFACHQCAKNTPYELAIKLKSPLVIVSKEEFSSVEIPLYTLKPEFDLFEFKKTMAKINLYNSSKNGKDIHHPIFNQLVGESQAVYELKSSIFKVASTNGNVLLFGETGTEKDIVASCLHYLSKDSNKAFVSLSCRSKAIPMLERELLNLESNRSILVSGGSLFINEIEYLPKPLQKKLLKIMQQHQSNNKIRFIVSSCIALERLLNINDAGKEFFAQFNFTQIYVPSLKERHEDLVLLAEYYLSQLQQRLHTQVVLTPNASLTLKQHSWPGNLPEFIHFLERLVTLYPDQILDAHHLETVFHHLALHDDAINDHGPLNIREYIARIEQQLIKTALHHSNGIVSAAAEYLSLARTTLIEKMKKYNLISNSD